MARVVVEMVVAVLVVVVVEVIVLIVVVVVCVQNNRFRALRPDGGVFNLDVLRDVLESLGIICDREGCWADIGSLRARSRRKNKSRSVSGV